MTGLFFTDGSTEHVQVLSVLTFSALLFCIDSIYLTVSMWNNNEESIATNSRNMVDKHFLIFIFASYLKLRAISYPLLILLLLLLNMIYNGLDHFSSTFPLLFKWKNTLGLTCTAISSPFSQSHLYSLYLSLFSPSLLVGTQHCLLDGNKR